mmetsp:Transcript_28343/g.79681  ORF Transcript_28343/g.79681 Transcript_28343/m.79681 type:complete len:246 (+) Transcript_28343:215-952(+)
MCLSPSRNHQPQQHRRRRKSLQRTNDDKAIAGATTQQQRPLFPTMITKNKNKTAPHHAAHSRSRRRKVRFHPHSSTVVARLQRSGESSSSIDAHVHDDIGDHKSSSLSSASSSCCWYSKKDLLQMQFQAANELKEHNSGRPQEEGETTNRTAQHADSPLPCWMERFTKERRLDKMKRRRLIMAAIQSPKLNDGEIATVSRHLSQQSTQRAFSHGFATYVEAYHPHIMMMIQGGGNLPQQIATAPR